MRLTSYFCILTCICCILSCKKDDDSPQELTYTLTVSSSDGGTVNLESGTFKAGSTLKLIATADQGYAFDSWAGDASGTDPEYSLILNQDSEVTATFRAIDNNPEISDNIVLINEDLIDTSGYVFAIENGGKRCFLMDRYGQLKHEWNFDLSLGQDAELTANGNLIGLFRGENSPVSFGGQSGILREIEPDGTVIWEYTIANDNEIAHHDFTQLPNGNLLVLVWYRVSNADAKAVGLNNDGDVFMEKVVEINKENNNVVWEWKSWDHIVQDFNASLPNFGVPEANKNKINIGYANTNVHEFVAQGDLIHFNGIAYYPEQDIIALSANFYSEVWFIDHSTTSVEAATEEGGQFNKGGSLLYRFGNQKVYGDNNATSTLNFNHHPSFIKKGNELSLLIYNNNNREEQSRAMEFSLPELDGTNLDLPPALLFDFTHPDLFYGRVSGAVRLPNGNTLICEGDYGYWEVTPNLEVVWKYEGFNQLYWRGLYYTGDSEEIVNLESRI